VWFWEIHFPPPIRIFLELELFWQVSDCLSRKNFWDLAKLNLIIQNVCKSQKPYEMVYKSSKMLKIWHNLCDFEKSSFHLQSVFPRSWNFSDKSQIVCQGKFFEISQSSIWLYKMYAKAKNLMKWYINQVKCWKYGIICVILRNPVSTSNQYFPGAGTFLVSPRLFVKEKFLRSRKAQSDYTKCMQKLKTIWNGI